MKIRFPHLSVSERRKIERWRQAELSPDEMARRLGRETNLCERVEHCLSCGWTHEKIAGRMRYEHAPGRVCQKTSYRHIFLDLGRKSEL